jgi:ribonuclease BN (tRNA processing enzyme)
VQAKEKDDDGASFFAKRLITGLAADDYLAVEVKGIREQAGGLSLTPKEYEVASSLASRFFLFVVKNFRESPFHEIFRKSEREHIRRGRHFSKACIEFRFDPGKSLRANIDDLLNQALEAQANAGGVNYVGAMIQHLVGAKLDLVLGEGKVAHHGFTVADHSMARKADFEVGAVAIHVTTNPSEALIRECAGNLNDGLKPVIVTCGSGVSGAAFLLEGANLAQRWAIERLVMADESRVTSAMDLLLKSADGRLLSHWDNPGRERNADMKIKLWGCRGFITTPGPTTLRYGGHTTCLEIRSRSGQVFVVDAGSGSRLLGKALRQEPAVTHIRFFFTHSHWDHLAGFPFFEPAYFSRYAITFCGGPHAQESIKRYLSRQMEAPYFPVDFSLLKAKFNFECHRHSDGDRFCCLDGIECAAAPLNHPNGGYGFKFVEDGKSLVFLTDNELGFAHDGGLPGAQYVEFCRVANMLLHDAQYTDQEYQRTRGWGHSTYADAVEFCRKRIARIGQPVECFAAAEGMVFEL